MQHNAASARVMGKQLRGLRPASCFKSAALRPHMLIACKATTKSSNAVADRRQICGWIASGMLTVVTPKASLALEPPVVQPSSSSSIANDDSIAMRVADKIQADFVDRQYYITGNLTKELYNPQCRFLDPTTDVKGVEPYTRAVATLFDPASSKAELISIKVVSPTSFVLRWRLEGALRAGGLRIKPYTGTTVYSLNPATGLIDSHAETWDISAADAFLSVLLPNSGAPPAPPIEVLRTQENQ